MILDTSFIIDLMRSEPSAVEELEEIEGKAVGEVTPITAFEIYYGAQKFHDTKKELQKIKETLESLKKLRLEWKDGIKAAELFYKLEEKGQKIEFNDVLLASIAKRRDKHVLTRDKSHFDRIEGLQVETY